MAIFRRREEDEELPPYLERVDELEFVNVVRLKGKIDQEMIPVIENRIQANRKAGYTISKNVLVDYALVEKIDSAAIAFHLVRLEEYREHGFKIGFVNVTDEMTAHLEVFKNSDAFFIFDTEDEAVAWLKE